MVWEASRLCQRAKRGRFLSGPLSYLPCVLSKIPLLFTSGPSEERQHEEHGIADSGDGRDAYARQNPTPPRHLSSLSARNL